MKYLGKSQHNNLSAVTDELWASQIKMEDISHVSLQDATEHARLVLHEGATAEIVFRGKPN